MNVKSGDYARIITSPRYEIFKLKDVWGNYAVLENVMGEESGVAYLRELEIIPKAYVERACQWIDTREVRGVL
jgi:hypothetical protein